MQNKETLSLRLPPDWIAKLKRIAKEEERTASDVAREAIRKFLKGTGS